MMKRHSSGVRAKSSETIIAFDADRLAGAGGAGDEPDAAAWRDRRRQVRRRWFCRASTGSFAVEPTKNGGFRASHGARQCRAARSAIRCRWRCGPGTTGDADGAGRHVASDVVGKADHTRMISCPRAGSNSKQRDDGAWANVAHLALDAEVGEDVGQQAGDAALSRLHLFERALRCASAFQQPGRRALIAGGALEAILHTADERAGDGASGFGNARAVGLLYRRRRRKTRGETACLIGGMIGRCGAHRHRGFERAGRLDEFLARPWLICRLRYRCGLRQRIRHRRDTRERHANAGSVGHRLVGLHLHAHGLLIGHQRVHRGLHLAIGHCWRMLIGIGMRHVLVGYRLHARICLRHRHLLHRGGLHRLRQRRPFIGWAGVRRAGGLRVIGVVLSE